jgi:hypothetical protein
MLQSGSKLPSVGVTRKKKNLKEKAESGFGGYIQRTDVKKYFNLY